MIRVSSKFRYCFFWIVIYPDGMTDVIKTLPFEKTRYHHVFPLKEFLREHGIDIRNQVLKVKVASPIWDYPKIYKYRYSRDTPFMVKLPYKTYSLWIVEIATDEWYLKDLEIPISSIYVGSEYFLPLRSTNIEVVAKDDPRVHFVKFDDNRIH